MIERTIRRFGRLFFDRDAIVRAALRAYMEYSLHGLGHFHSPASEGAEWIGDIKRGAIRNFRDWLEYEVMAWTEEGVVGLALGAGCGPIQQLDLSVDAVTGGPDDVRGAVPGLPEELEPALVLATSMLNVEYDHGERSAGVGFWLYGDHIGGTLFLVDDPYSAWGAERLAAWGLLHKGRLLPLCCEASPSPRPGKIVVNYAGPQEEPAHAIMDAVVDRRMKGPTEFTPAELETLLHSPPTPDVQHRLQKVGITWPGSPELPPETPQPSINPFVDEGYEGPKQLTHYFGPVVFNRDAIVRAALRAYIEAILAPLDPLARHTLTACVVPKWTGDLQRGAFFNGDGCGDYDVVAWSEGGVVGLAYKRGFAPIQPLGAALPGLPDELLPALELATGLLDVGAHGEKLACVGFWLSGDHPSGTLLDDPTLPGARRLVAWGALDRLVPWGTLNKQEKGRLPLLGDRKTAALAAMLARTTASPIHALLDAVVDRRLRGPTELLPDELSMLFPTLPDPEERFFAQWMLQKAGITWPGSPERHEAPRGAGRSPFLASPRAIARCHPLGYLAFDRDAIVRAALRAYVEATLAIVDPLERHKFMAGYYRSTWIGNLKRGALSDMTIVAWTEAGVVGLIHEDRPPPTEWLPADVVARAPNELRRAVPDLPNELLPAFEMAFGLFNERHSPRLKVAPVGFWLCGDRASGTLFDAPTALGVWSLARWGRVGRGRLLPTYHVEYATTITEDTFRNVAPLLAVADAITARALVGPTEILPDEIATILPKPPLKPYYLADAKARLQNVGITWPSSPELAESPH